jgi:hypothetical protein
MIPIVTTRLHISVRLLLLLVAAPFLAAACPLQQATYVLRTTGNDWMRIGPAENGEVILRFTLGKRETSVPLSQVLDRIQIERLDAGFHPVAGDLNAAPAFIRIYGLARISDAPDGEWRLVSCAAR